MITPKNKTIFTLAALGFLVLHFTATFFYVAPLSWTGQRFKNYSNFYMLPLFHQGWSLFAPSPPMVNKKTNLTIVFPDGSQKEEVLFSDFVESHHTYRAGISGRFSLLRGNTMHTFYENYIHYQNYVKDPKKNLNYLKSSPGGKALKHLIGKWVEYRYPQLKDQSYQVKSELIFENYKDYLKEERIKRDTVHMQFNYIAE